MAREFRTPVEFRWQEAWPKMSTPAAGVTFLEQLPARHRQGDDYEAALWACRRATETDHAEDIEAARKALLLFTQTKLPR